MHAHLLTTAVETWAGTGTACPVSTRSWHQTQGRRAGGSSPAAVARNKPQACELGRRVDRRSLSRIQLGGILPLPQLGVKRCIALPRLYSANTKACRPRVRQSLAHEQVVQAVAHVPHFHNRVLSNPPSSDGFKTIGKAFVDGQNPFAWASKND